MSRAPRPTAPEPSAPSDSTASPTEQHFDVLLPTVSVHANRPRSPAVVQSAPAKPIALPPPPYVSDQVKITKLPAGDMIVYPGTSLHNVTSITRGGRSCSTSTCRSGGSRPIIPSIKASCR